MLDRTVWEESEVVIVLVATAEVMSVVVSDAVVVKPKSEVVDDSDEVETKDEVSGESKTEVGTGGMVAELDADEESMIDSDVDVAYKEKGAAPEVETVLEVGVM